METAHTKATEELRALRSKADEEKKELKLSVAVQGLSTDVADVFMFRVGNTQVEVGGDSEATLCCVAVDVTEASKLEMVGGGAAGEVLHEWPVSSVPFEEKVDLASDAAVAKTCVVQVARIVSRTSTEIAEKEKLKEALFKDRMQIKRDMGEIQQAQRTAAAAAAANSGGAAVSGGSFVGKAAKKARTSRVLAMWNSMRKYSTVLFLGMFGLRNILFFIGGVGALHYFGDDLAV